MKRFLKGWVFGTGFAAGFLCILFMVISLQRCSNASKNIRNTDAVKVLDFRTEVVRGQPRILGTVTNTTEYEITSVIIEGYLFGTNGTFLTKNEEYINTLPSHDAYHFKMGFPCDLTISSSGVVSSIVGGVSIKSDTEITGTVSIKQGFLKR